MVGLIDFYSGARAIGEGLDSSIKAYQNYDGMRAYREAMALQQQHRGAPMQLQPQQPMVNAPQAANQPQQPQYPVVDAPTPPVRPADLPGPQYYGATLSGGEGMPRMARAMTPGDGLATEFAGKWAQTPGMSMASGPVPGFVRDMQPTPEPVRPPAPQPHRAGGVMTPPGNIPQSLIRTESGGNWRAQNNAMGAGGQAGHFGRLQFGQARLAEAAAAGAIPQGVTPQQFMASPEIQQRAEAWHFQDIDNFIARNGLDQAIGQQIKGVPVTLDGMRAVAHLGGNGGLKRFVETGGQYNPSDANGTSLLSYLSQHGGQAQTNRLANVAPMGQPQPVQVAQAGTANLGQAFMGQSPQIPPELMMRMMRGENTRGIANTLMAQQFMDPAQRQLQQIQIAQGLKALQGDPETERLKREGLSLENQMRQKTLTEGATKDVPAQVREYQFYAQQERAAGREPDSFVKWDRDNKSAGRSQTNVNVGGGSDKQFFDAADESVKAARTAVTGLQSIENARKAVEGGGVFGLGADQRLGLQKLGAAFGVVDDKAIVNTETFKAAIAPQVGAMLRVIAGNAQFSNADLQTAKDAAGGNITLNEKSIKSLLNIMERANRVVIEDHNKRVDAIYPEEGGKFARERSLFRLNAGTPSTQGQRKTSTGVQWSITP